ncbi:uncharacterized protein LOC126746457 [Anthonomus grandis grandis]|uniref:uncharacterized protein LOC126746457 n=1 Tax=Anthonomus grandis grandis TaxID=2921223 RepID=UPI0021669CA9|nr:uncharacterized protein LOC126746457 [Anthonomus grandis grandis]
MSDDKKQIPPGGADPVVMDQLLENITSEVQTNDFVPLGGFGPQSNLNWAPQMPYYNSPYQEQPCRTGYSTMFQSVPLYPKEHYGSFNMRAPPLYTFPQQESLHAPPPHTQIFENLVGNWAVPNKSGTYSPFGNSDTFKQSLFEFHSEEQQPHEDLIFPDNDKFNFNKDLKKSRPLAEVKPMRPSYSDVLAKSVPLKSPKSEPKESKVKRDAKRKSDKNSRGGITLNRSNTNNEIKEIPSDKGLPKTDKKQTVKVSQLNRKWSSMDNLSAHKSEEPKKKREEAKNVGKSKSKAAKSVSYVAGEVSVASAKVEPVSSGKNLAAKKSKVSRQRPSDNNGAGDRSSSKRAYRTKRKEDQPALALAVEKIKSYTEEWWKVSTVFTRWLFHLISDVLSLSLHLGRDFLVVLWSNLLLGWSTFFASCEDLLRQWRVSAWLWEKIEGKFKKRSRKPKIEEEAKNFLNNGLDINISMPATGEEAMKRLLACKGKDPYSILGVTPKCTDDDIKKYYKRQAFLVHPDKNNQPGAEEAFKILVHAFDMIGTSERRATYDRGVAESAFVVQNFSQMAELLQQLQQKMEMNANTIRCSACGDRHKRVKVDRPSYAARNCKSCKIHHSAREGDIWAEGRYLNVLWRYYACMEGHVYDISEWAACQKQTLKHLKPDSHHVQYRIALGKQQQQQQNGGGTRKSGAKTEGRPDLENLLNSLYGAGGTEGGAAAKRRNKSRK